VYILLYILAYLLDADGFQGQKYQESLPCTHFQVFHLVHSLDQQSGATLAQAIHSHHSLIDWKPVGQIQKEQEKWYQMRLTSGHAKS